MIVLMSTHKKKKYQEQRAFEIESKVLEKVLENITENITENINVLYDQKTKNELRWVEDLMK